MNALPAGQSSALDSARRGAMDSVRYHTWEKGEPTSPRAPAAEVQVRTAPVRQDTKRFSPPRRTSDGLGSGNAHPTGLLASGVSESETRATPRSFSTQPEVSALMRFQGPTSGRGGRKGVQPPLEQAQKSKEACRYHQYERPALHTSGDRSEPAGAGLRSQDREERISGNAHGRSLTADYHARYAANAAGSSLPCSDRVHPEMTGQGAVATPREGVRRMGACDPRVA